ncbi:MAG: hypothetical protein HF967_08625, partial [Methanosarcinales archaeon]|nr:hypothetical protein [Methanosarcinales archaeon]
GIRIYSRADFNDIAFVSVKTGSDCTFRTNSDCIFDTGSTCTFDTGSYCTFDTGSNCTFNTGSDCVVVRRDIYEVIELQKNQKIKLNNYGIKGYTTGKEETIKIGNKEYYKKEIEKALKDVKSL